MLHCWEVFHGSPSRVFRDNGLSAFRDAGWCAWLNRLTDNELSTDVRHHLRQKRGGGQPHQQDVWNDDGSRRLWEALQAGESTARQQLTYAESRDSLHAHIADLPADYRRVIQWKYFQEMSLAEIARRMQRTEGAVRGLMERARRVRRKCFDAE